MFPPYFHSLQGSHQGNDRDLIEVAVKALEMLSKIESGQLSSEDTELGSFLSSGELPHPQACILYILRAGIIEHLGETGQVGLQALQASF